MLQVWFGLCSSLCCREQYCDIPVQLCIPVLDAAFAGGEQPSPLVWPWCWLMAPGVTDSAATARPQGAFLGIVDFLAQALFFLHHPGVGVTLGFPACREPCGGWLQMPVGYQSRWRIWVQDFCGIAQCIKPNRADLPGGLHLAH